LLVLALVGLTFQLDAFLYRAGTGTSGARSIQPTLGLLAANQGFAAPRNPPQPVTCPTPPTSYQPLPNVTAAGDLTVPMSLGTGPGIATPGIVNPNLCFVYTPAMLPAAPVIRVKPGHLLTIPLINTLNDTSPPALEPAKNTQNCPIENYLSGPPVPDTCSQPEEGFTASPGADGSFYPIESNVPMLADGSTNLHTHGLEVSPQPCHDEVILSTLFPANWGGPQGTFLPCQSPPNKNNLTYTYQIPPDHPTGLYWYHTHRHGQAQAETMMGASGAIVIEGIDDVTEGKVTDDVMVIRDFPIGYVSGVPKLAHRRDSNRRFAHARGSTQPGGPPVDPRIDRDNEVSCGTNDPDSGGPQITRLTLNGALVQETPTFPPPDDKVLRKTMVAGKQQAWRILNAGAQTYVSPQLVLSRNGINTVLPLVIIALDGVPVRPPAVVDTRRRPLLLATANRVELLVNAPPRGATLYLDSLQVNPGCAGDGVPASRLLRAVSTIASQTAATSADDGSMQPNGQATQFADTFYLDRQPSVQRVFAFTEYPRSFTVAQSNWVPNPPQKGQFDDAATDFYLSMIKSSDGEGLPVQIRPFSAHTLTPDVVVHLRGRQSVTEEWTIQNYTLEIHAFHIHQIHFLDVTPGDEIGGRPPILDTVNVPAASRIPSSIDPNMDVPNIPGFVRLRLTFTSRSIGEFVAHCHILEHEDNGMMLKVRVEAN
jgi:FtsP/CotA-like multicopper oxidase with cupredoxin domain